jgi:hypothetical protein
MNRYKHTDLKHFDGRGEPIVEIIQRRTEDDVKKQKTYFINGHSFTPAAFNIFQGEIIYTLKKQRPEDCFVFIMTSLPFAATYDGNAAIAWTGHWDE